MSPLHMSHQIQTGHMMKFAIYGIYVDGTYVGGTYVDGTNVDGTYEVWDI